MNLRGGELIESGITYKVELCRAEEVAELGDHARTENLILPDYFEKDNETKKYS